MVFLSNKNHLQSFHNKLIFLQLHIALALLSRFTKLISTFLDYNEFCTNERRGNIQKKPRKTSLDLEKLNNRVRDPEAYQGFISEGFCFGFWFWTKFIAYFRALVTFCAGLFSNKPLHPVRLIILQVKLLSFVTTLLYHTAEQYICLLIVCRRAVCVQALQYQTCA